MYDKTEIEENLKEILKLRPNSINILSSRESNQLEFKQNFNLASGSEYARNMAAFANNEGGYLVFGVQDVPHKIVEVSRERFEGVDTVKITDIVNSYFSPEIEWEMGCIEFNKSTLGYIYTFEAIDKPIIATKTCADIIKEGSIYYRYRGKTTLIKHSSLQKIIENRLNRERKAWLQHIEVISKSGPTKVGILDTIQGKVFGTGTQFIIDEKLLRQLKVVREGTFKDTGGTPTLRLIGELKTVDGVRTEKIVNMGIHYDDLVTAFLAQRELNSDDAKTYLKESVYQNTPYSPLFYFIIKAGINLKDAINLIDSIPNSFSFKNRKKKLKERIEGISRVPIFGNIDDSIKPEKINNVEELMLELNNQETIKGKRSVIYYSLKNYSAIIRDASIELPTSILLEAIMNLSNVEIIGNKISVLNCLLNIFNQKFSALEGEKSLFRKTVAFIEEQLYVNELEKE